MWLHMGPHSYNIHRKYINYGNNAIYAYIRADMSEGDEIAEEGLIWQVSPLKVLATEQRV